MNIVHHNHQSRTRSRSLYEGGPAREGNKRERRIREGPRGRYQSWRGAGEKAFEMARFEAAGRYVHSRASTYVQYVCLCVCEACTYRFPLCMKDDRCMYERRARSLACWCVAVQLTGRRQPFSYQWAITEIKVSTFHNFWLQGIACAALPADRSSRRRASIKVDALCCMVEQLERCFSRQAFPMRRYQSR